MALHRFAAIAPGESGYVRILSIDGGGMRGIIPATVLQALQDRLQRPLWQVFDLVAGTSTGGIIALALTRPGQAHSPGDVVDLYVEEGPVIFGRSLWHLLGSGAGVLGPKYDAAALEGILERYFGVSRLGDALTKVMVTSYDTAAASPYLFKSFRPAPGGFAGSPGGPRSPDDHLMWQAARATSAAPTFFAPFELPRIEGGPSRSLVDGGVFANNPGMCALAEAIRSFPDRKYLVVSVGTGADQEKLGYREVKAFGLAGWARPILKVVFDGVSDTVDQELTQILGDANYVRFQRGGRALPMDDASPRAIASLRREADDLVRASVAKLDRVAEMLDASPGVAGPAR